ncbi:MAG TPA: flavin reductase family protein [Candidatus Tumulicola sp.]
MTPGAQFRAAMRHVPSAVTIVTSLRHGEPRGLTLTAFASVSVDPPALLICVNREARSYLYISESKVFCLNLLSGEQRDLAERFSGKVRERQFETVDYASDVTGSPVLAGSIAHFDCRVLEEHHVGSHSIFVGEVVSCVARAGSPLGYFDGDYRDFGIRIE